MVALDMVEDVVSSRGTKVTDLTAPVSFHEDGLLNQDGLKLLEIIQRGLGRFPQWSGGGLDSVSVRVILELELTCCDEGTIGDCTLEQVGAMVGVDMVENSVLAAVLELTFQTQPIFAIEQGQLHKNGL